MPASRATRRPDGLARLDWALADKPDLVILELGANDMLRGIDPTIVRANLAAMIEQDPGGRRHGIAAAGMQAAPNWGAAYQQSFDGIYPELAQATTWRFIRSFSKVWRWTRRSTSPTACTPTREASRSLVDRIAPYVARLIGGRS